MSGLHTCLAAQRGHCPHDYTVLQQAAHLGYCARVGDPEPEEGSAPADSSRTACLTSWAAWREARRRLTAAAMEESPVLGGTLDEMYTRVYKTISSHHHVLTILDFVF